MNSEEHARETIDGLPTKAGWAVHDASAANIQAPRGVANLKRVKTNLKRHKAAVLKAGVEGRLVEPEAEIARREGPDDETGEQLRQRILAKCRRRCEYAELANIKAKGKAPKDDKWKAKYKEPSAPDITDLPEWPEGWLWARLDAIVALKGGMTVDRKSEDPTARSVPYLRVTNVQRGYIDLSDVKFINASETHIKELRLRQGDILFNEGGDRYKLGRGWIWEGQ